MPGRQVPGQTTARQTSARLDNCQTRQLPDQTSASRTIARPDKCQEDRCQAVVLVLLVKFDWVNNITLGPVLIYYEVQSSFNWYHGVLEGDRGLRLYTPPLFQIGYTLMRRRDMFILALERLGREDPSLANRLLMRFVRSALYLGAGARPS